MSRKSPINPKSIFRTQHSSVFFLEPKLGKAVIPGTTKDIVVRTAHSKEPNPNTYSCALSIAKLLYPRNFPRQLATLVYNGKVRRESTISERVPLDKASEMKMRRYYKGSPPAKVKQAPAVKRLVKQIEDESGIIVNDLGMNVGRAKGQPVFFEVVGIRPLLLRQRIMSMPDGLKKKQALVLLKALVDTDFARALAKMGFDPYNSDYEIITHQQGMHIG